MATVTGKIILAFQNDPTPEEQLKAEQYLNSTVANMTYANLGFTVRVHLDGDSK